MDLEGDLSLFLKLALVLLCPQRTELNWNIQSKQKVNAFLQAYLCEPADHWSERCLS